MTTPHENISEPAVVRPIWTTFAIERGRARMVRAWKLPAREQISWPQRPEVRGPLTRVKVLAGEVGPFLDLQPGTVVDLPRELAEPGCEMGASGWRRPTRR
jgi:hypothetical protein